MLVLGSYSLLEQTLVVANNVVVLWWWRSPIESERETWVWGALLGFSVAGKFTVVAVVGLIGCLTKRSVTAK